MKITRSLLFALALLTFAALPAAAQARYSFFGADVFGSPNGFGVGAGLEATLPGNFSFEPSALIGRRAGHGLLTLDGSFLYTFHPDDEAFIPYLLGGIGMAQYGGNTFGSAIAGAGARIPIGHDRWIQIEARAGAHGLGRLSIGLSKSF